MSKNLFKFLAFLPLILIGQRSSVFAAESQVEGNDIMEYNPLSRELLTNAPTTRKPTVTPTTQYPTKVPSTEPSTKVPTNVPTQRPSTLEPTENQSCPSSSHSNCKLLSVSKCNVTAISIFSNSSDVALIGGVFSGSSIKSCLFKVNCTVSSLLANRTLANSFDAKDKPQPFSPIYIPTTKDSIPEGYDCKEKSSFNCSVIYLEMTPTPDSPPINSTYILDGVGALNCSSIYNCMRVSPSCERNSDMGLSGMTIEEIIE